MTLVLTNDDFGARIASLLLRSQPVELMPLPAVLDAGFALDRFSMIAVCVNRPCFRIFRELCKKAACAKVAVFLVYPKDSDLFFGPLIVPGKSPCYECFEKRMLSSIMPPWSLPLERAVRRSFDQDDSLHIPGLPPAAAFMAAARVRRAALLAPEDWGRVARLNLSDSLVTEYTVMRVHGCVCLAHPPTEHLFGKHSISAGVNSYAMER